MSTARLGRFVSILEWLPRYEGAWLRADLVAGLTSASVVIPKSLAYATIASVPLGMGLGTVVLPLFVYVLLGASRRLSVSTTSTISILTAAAVTGAVAGGGADAFAATATLAVLVGAFLLLAMVLRLGFLADFISEPVLTGFKAGIGVVIVIGQAPKLLGVHIDGTGPIRDILAILRATPETSIPTLLLSLATLGLMAGLPFLLPKAPAPLVAVAAGIVASKLLGLSSMGVAVVGDVPLGLPSFSMPSLALAQALWPAAIGIALMSFTETIAAGRAFAEDDERRPRASQELLAIGAGNALGGVFGAMPSGGGTSQTAVNARSGARSQVAGAVTGGVAVACLLFLGPLLAALPQATLAAVVIVTSLPLIQPKEFRDIRAIRRAEFIWALTAFAGVAVLGTLKGIVVAVVVSLGFVAAAAQNPNVYVLGRKRGTNVFRPLGSEHPDDETFPDLILVRLEGRLFFPNAQRVADKLAPIVADAKRKVVVLDFSGVLDLEYTALKMLVAGEERMRKQGTIVCLAALNPEVRRVVEASPLGARLGHERMFFNLEQAVASYRSLLPASATA